MFGGGGFPDHRRRPKKKDKSGPSIKPRPDRLAPPRHLGPLFGARANFAEGS
jgi:hypothetical protein